jgi:protein O-mannosyl-transferase
LGGLKNALSAVVDVLRGIITIMINKIRFFLLTDHRERLLSLLLMVLILAACWQVWDFAFVYFDDGEYIIQNRNIQNGFTWESISWAFTTLYFANWHPLTWLSYMLDYQLFGLFAGGYHLMNVFFHIANVLLLFLVLREATGAIWRSFLVAALFGLHPIHVESVAWISERKDVLSAFFWMLTMLAYVRYVKGDKKIWYGAALLFFALGLMAKPMLVTLPFVLLLLDYWPLKRFSIPNRCGNGGLPEIPAFSWSIFRALLLEKIPFFLLSAASSTITYIAQTKGGAVQTFETFPLFVRILNANLAYFLYLGNTAWPVHLTIFYPHAGPDTCVWQGIEAFFVLLMVSAAAFLNARKRPYFLVGWFWFLGTLVPVIGLIQVGAQSMADRYTYIPLIGVFVALAWFLPRETFKKRKVFSMFLCVMVSGCIFFEHNLKVVRETAQVHYILYQTERERGNVVKSRNHYDRALQINSTWVAKNYNKSGYFMVEEGDLDNAETQFRQAIKIKSHYVKAWNNLGVVLARKGNLDEAEQCLITALEIVPEDADSKKNLINVIHQRDLSKATSEEKEKRGKK